MQEVPTKIEGYEPSQIRAPEARQAMPGALAACRWSTAERLAWLEMTPGMCTRHKIAEARKSATHPQHPPCGVSAFYTGGLRSRSVALRTKAPAPRLQIATVEMRAGALSGYQYILYPFHQI